MNEYRPDQDTLNDLVMAIDEVDGEHVFRILDAHYRMWKEAHPGLLMPGMERLLATYERYKVIKRLREEEEAYALEFDEIVDRSYTLDEQDFLYRWYGSDAG